VVIATKAAGPTPASLVAAARARLRRRQPQGGVRPAAAPAIEHIDLYQLHWPSRNAPIFGNNVFNPKQERPCIAIEETLAALGDLVKEGKIGAIGVSNESNWGVSEFIKQSEMKACRASPPSRTCTT
jgi:aryl-alcohol dehydrogenase-like predicted oxidoreductase